MVSVGPETPGCDLALLRSLRTPGSHDHPLIWPSQPRMQPRLAAGTGVTQADVTVASWPSVPTLMPWVEQAVGQAQV